VQFVTGQIFARMRAGLAEVETAKAAAAAVPGSAVPGSDGFKPNGRMVAIGCTTGGVAALLTVLAAYPAQCPPTVIAQHIKPAFTASLSRRPNRGCAATVTEAVEGAPLLPGRSMR